MRLFSYGGTGVHNALPWRIVFGPGALRAPRRRTRSDRLQPGPRVGTTPGRAAMAEPVVRALGARCVGLLAEAVSQVPIELAVEGRRRARALNADCLVSFGGGAAIGLGKGIALETGHANRRRADDLFRLRDDPGFCGITIDGVKRMGIESLDVSTDGDATIPSSARRYPLAVSERECHERASPIASRLHTHQPRARSSPMPA